MRHFQVLQTCRQEVRTVRAVVSKRIDSTISRGRYGILVVVGLATVGLDVVLEDML